jgi:hypothetical protein
MTPSELPQVVLARIMLMQRHAETCAREADAAERARDAQRAALSDRRPLSMREHKAGSWNMADEQRKLDTLTQSATALRTAARIETEILQRCRAWLDALPTVGLELVSPAVGEQDTLQTVRARLQDIAAELKRLNLVPLPDPRLRHKIEAYVQQLAANAHPELQGIAAGETLRVYWPAEERAGRRQLNGFDTITANALLMTAWLQPGLLVDRLVAIANRMADEYCPAAERPARIAALQDEILLLRYAEEAFVTRALAAGDPIVRDPAAPVEAVLLVRVKAAKVTKSPPREATESRSVEETIGVSPG